jgi:hypothetical protein
MKISFIREKCFYGRVLKLSDMHSATYEDRPTWLKTTNIFFHLFWSEQKKHTSAKLQWYSVLLTAIVLNVCRGQDPNFLRSHHHCHIQRQNGNETFRVRTKYQTVPIIGLYSLLAKKGDCLARYRNFISRRQFMSCTLRHFWKKMDACRASLIGVVSSTQSDTVRWMLRLAALDITLNRLKISQNEEWTNRTNWQAETKHTRRSSKPRRWAAHLRKQTAAVKINYSVKLKILHYYKNWK